MGQLQVTQIQRRLEQTVAPHIDLSDLQGQGEQYLNQAKLTRSLAAFVVMKISGLQPQDAAATVTDASLDNGIDAIAVLPDEARIIVVQSKWSNEGKGSAALDDMIKFREGINDLVQLKWDSFNEKVTSRRDEIESLLLEPSVSIDIVFAHTGSGNLASDVRARMDDYVVELNDPTETASFVYYGQAEIHGMLVNEQQLPKINLVVEISDWGSIDGPPTAIYGQVGGSEIASWYKIHGKALLAKNVRVVLPDSEVNNSLVATLNDDQKSFWYYNNGITVLCDEIIKAPAGGADRRVGTFSFSGASVVNGAQTVGALAKFAAQKAEPDLSAARVMVRFISLAGSAAGFSSEVTRATNTQNRIGGRDFLSLDPEQSRLRDEFAVDELEYVYRSGEVDPPSERGCGVVEATIALACNQPTATLTTQAKREISRLWEDISKAPYRTLFNPSTNYLRVWRSVEVMRAVDTTLIALNKILEGRGRGVAVHGNRHVLHLVFRQLGTKEIDNPKFDWPEEVKKSPMLTLGTVNSLIHVVEEDFPGYPASLFKNASRAEQVCNQVLERIKSLPEGEDSDAIWPIRQIPS